MKKSISKREWVKQHGVPLLRCYEQVLNSMWSLTSHTMFQLYKFKLLYSLGKEVHHPGKTDALPSDNHPLYLYFLLLLFIFRRPHKLTIFLSFSFKPKLDSNVGHGMWCDMLAICTPKKTFSRLEGAPRKREPCY